MLARSAICEAAISALPDHTGLRFAMRGEIEALMDAYARLSRISDFGDAAIYAVEITVASVIP